MAAAALVARLVLAGVFAVAGVTKLADLSGSGEALEAFGLPRRLTRPAGVVLPLVELATATCLLVSAWAWWGAVSAAVLLAAFIAGIAVNMAQGREPDCHCFGQLHSAPAGKGTLARNGVLLALSVVVLAAGRGTAGHLSATHWLTQLDAAEVALTGTVVILALAVLIGGWFTLELFRQHGRVLLRLEALEQRAGIAAAGGNGHVNGNGNGRAHGLHVGVPAPEFTLPALDGEAVTLEDLRSGGRPVMLVFTDPGCGPCNSLIPDIARWQADHADTLTIALVSRGSAEDNRAKSTEHPVSNLLLQDGREVSERYKVSGTPSALLISHDGHVASSLVGGPESIRELLAGALRPDGLQIINAGPRHHANPNPPPGLAVGTPVPELALTTLDGGTLRTATFAGTPATVIFWNPGCGFCQKLLPDLRDKLTREKVPPERVILISTGTVEDNRTLDLPATIVIDEDFAAGRAFSAAGTPSAVLVGPDGNVASPLATGGPAVLELLSSTTLTANR